jgi:hypothetical protein
LQKTELTSIVDTVCSNWTSAETDKVTLYRTWWRYLSDLEYQQTLKIIDELIISGQRWIPRVGDVRRLVMNASARYESLPSSDIAWGYAESRWNAVALGTEPPSSGSPATDSAIGEAMRQSGHPERRAFIASWETVRSSIEMERYALPDDAPSVIK